MIGHPAAFVAWTDAHAAAVTAAAAWAGELGKSADEWAAYYSERTAPSV